MNANFLFASFQRVSMTRPELPPLDHLTRPPDRRFWINDLRIGTFGEVVASAQRDARLQRLYKTYRGPGRRVLDLVLLACEDSPQVLEHADLVAWALRGVMTRAILDAAGFGLTEAWINASRRDAGGFDPLALGFVAYLHDPQVLLRVRIAEQWHRHARAIFDLVGQRRRSAPDDAEAWHAHAVAALAGSHEAWLRRCRIVAALRRGPEDVLVGISQQTNEWEVLDEPGTGNAHLGVKARTHVLRFYDGGSLLDVSSHRPEELRTLAEATASRWAGPVCYRPLLPETTSRRIQNLLERLLDPRDDELPLLGFTAHHDGLPGRPRVSVQGEGDGRVEDDLAVLCPDRTLQGSWDRCRDVKVGYEKRRFLVRFPQPGEPMVVTYIDADRDKGVTKAFADHVLRVADLRVVPRARVAVVLALTQAREPSRMTASAWTRLLQPVDHPAA